MSASSSSGTSSGLSVASASLLSTIPILPLKYRIDSSSSRQPASILTGSVLELSLSFLRLREVLQVNRVSRSWLQASDSKLVWRALVPPSEQLFIDCIFTSIRLPLNEEDWNRCIAPKVERLSWRAYSTKIIAKYFHNHRHARSVSMLRRMLEYVNLFPSPAFQIPWLTSSICRRHIPLSISLPPAALCQEETVPEILTIKQANALKHFSAFTEIHSISVDLDLDLADSSWLSRILSSPVIHRVRYFTTFSPDVWANASQLNEVALRLTSLQQIRFSMWMCRQCDNPHHQDIRNPNCLLAARKKSFRKDPNNYPPPTDLSQFRSVRGVCLENINEWSQWECLSSLPTLRSLFVFRLFDLPPTVQLTHESFSLMPKKMGLQKIVKLNLACPTDIAPLSAESWSAFLRQLPSLRWLRAEGAAMRSFMNALKKLGSETLPQLKEVRWRVGTTENLDEFHSDEFEELLPGVVDRFPATHFRVILPAYGMLINNVPDQDYFSIFSRMDHLMKLNIPRLYIERNSEEDDGGFATMVETEEGESIY